MIRRPPRSTLFPYTDALPISRIGIADEGGEGVGQPVRALAGVALRRQADESPMDRNPDLKDALAADVDPAQPLGDDRRNFELAALGRHPHAVAALDPLLAGELLGHLHERLRLQANEQRDVL